MDCTAPPADAPIGMRHLLAAPLAAVLVAVALGTTAAGARAAPGLVVGVDDDTVKWIARPNGLLAVDRDLGLGAVRVTIPWRRGETRPTPLAQTYLHRVSTLVASGQRVVLAVYGTPEQAPTDARGRSQYCGFLRHVVTRIPLRDFVIWNEANSPTFWPTRAGAVGYEALLARCWDTLHAVRANVNVISSTAARHDPAGFVRALGDVYRASGRTRPLVDTFGHNPYPNNASEVPWAVHGDDEATVGEGDLSKLLAALEDGFGGTAQPLPAPDRPTLWYLEIGFQTAVPQTKARFYHGTENDVHALPPLADGSGAQRERRDQAHQLTDALLLAYCQPVVGAFFNFELIDEGRLGGWQSGLLWRDGTKKPSYEVFKQAIARVAAGDVDCATVRGAGAR
jgi:hypothetical protein